MENQSGGRGVNRYIQMNGDYSVRTASRDGMSNLVVPVVMMVEGVHNGSQGPILHLPENFRESVHRWEGEPVTIGHPQDNEGTFVSAGTDEGRKVVVGYLHNVRVDSRNRLVGEAWLDRENLIKNHISLYNILQDRRPLDVSIGIFSDEVREEGQWNDERYIAVATNYRPDHLALLPGEVGACSWQDGCGVRVNKNNGGKLDVMSKVNKVNKVKVNKGDTEMEVILNVNETGLRTIMQNIQTILDEMDNDMKLHYLKEMYEDYVIYEVRKEGNGTSLYHQSFQVDEETGSVELMGEAEEVREKTEYVTVNTETKEDKSMKRTKFNNNNKNKGEMSKTDECLPCVKEKVNSLIANKLTKWTEDDREFLQGLSEENLGKMEVQEVKPEPQTNVQKTEKVDDPIQTLSTEDKAALEYGKRRMKEEKDSLIKSIQANAKDVWKDEDLQRMDIEMLERIDKSITVNVKKDELETIDYSLRNGSAYASYEEIEPMPLTGMELDK